MTAAGDNILINILFMWKLYTFESSKCVSFFQCNNNNTVEVPYTD